MTSGTDTSRFDLHDRREGPRGWGGGGPYLGTPFGLTEISVRFALSAKPCHRFK